MVKYSCIIVDDELPAIHALRHEIEQHCPELHIIGTASSLDSSIAMIRELRPDIIFLDIRLADGLGFDILHEIEDLESKVIFVTAYGQYAIEAFKFNSIDYLLKPVSKEDLRNAVNKLIRADAADLRRLLLNFRNNFKASDAEKRIAISDADGYHLFEVNEILRLKAERNYTRFFIANGKELLTSKTLKEFSGMLAPYNFLRIHNSHIINLNLMRRYINRDGGFVEMSDDSMVPVSQRKRGELLKLLSQMND